MINFKFNTLAAINESIQTKQKLAANHQEDIFNCGLKIAEAVKNGNKVLFCGNGGSAADCQHLAAELVIRFRGSVSRPALPGIALNVDTSILTAGGNDIGFDNVFAREVEAYGRKDDIIVALSTSGNSENIIRAISKAKELGMQVVALLGGSGGKIKDMCKYKVIVPSEVTARIQESHIMIGHIWCEMIEEYCYPELFKK